MTSAHANLPQVNGQQVKVREKNYSFSSALTAWVLGGAIAAEFTDISPAIFDENDSVILTGSGFTGATAVKFNSLDAANFTVDSDTQITATPPTVSSNTDTVIQITLASGAILVGPNVVINQGGAADADAIAVVDAIIAAGGSLTPSQENAVLARVAAFKSDGIWGDLFAYYGFAGGTADSHKINWKNPGSNDISWDANITHDGQGSQGDGSSEGDFGFTIPNPEYSLFLFQNLINNSGGAVRGILISNSTARRIGWQQSGSTGSEMVRIFANSSTTSQAFPDVGDVVGYHSITMAPGDLASCYHPVAGVRSMTITQSEAIGTFRAFSISGSSESNARLGSAGFFNTNISDPQDADNRASEQAYQTAMGR